MLKELAACFFVLLVVVFRQLRMRTQGLAETWVNGLLPRKVYSSQTPNPVMLGRSTTRDNVSFSVFARALRSRVIKHAHNSMGTLRAKLCGYFMCQTRWVLHVPTLRVLMCQLWALHAELWALSAKFVIH